MRKVRRDLHRPEVKREMRKRGDGLPPSLSFSAAAVGKRANIYQQVKQKPRTNNERWCVYLKDGGGKGNEGVGGRESA